MKILGVMFFLALIAATESGIAECAEGSGKASLEWKDALKQAPEWYAGDEAARIAANVVLFQRDTGGWPKDFDPAGTLSDAEKTKVVERKQRKDSTIDNHATTREIAFLAMVSAARKDEALQEPVLKGIGFLLSAQYANGGWPQAWPEGKDYKKRITFNDEAMTDVMFLLRDVSKGAGPFGFADQALKAKAAEAAARGVDCILKCQIIRDGKRTAWCSQHDETTFAPAEGRSFEKPSLSGRESVRIVSFLMLVEPSPQVIEAVEGAIAWFKASGIKGIRVERKEDPSLKKGHDIVVAKDESAPVLWARFYEIASNRPFFCGRDGVAKESLAEIEHERRIGYTWYTDKPKDLLEKEYPAWKARIESGAKAQPITPREEIERQIGLLKAEKTADLQSCFTERLRDRITDEAVSAGKAEVEKYAIDDLFASVETGEREGRKTAKIKMKNGRTLTTLVLVDGRWLADTIWFR